MTTLFVYEEEIFFLVGGGHYVALRWKFVTLTNIVLVLAEYNISFRAFLHSLVQYNLIERCGMLATRNIISLKYDASAKTH